MWHPHHHKLRQPIISGLILPIVLAISASVLAQSNVTPSSNAPNTHITHMRLITDEHDAVRQRASDALEKLEREIQADDPVRSTVPPTHLPKPVKEGAPVGLSFGTESSAETDCYDQWRSAVESESGTYFLPTPQCINRIIRYYADRFEEVTRFAVGRTVQGQIIYALRLASPDGRTPIHERSSALFVGSQHGNESSSTRALLDWIDHVLTKPNTRLYPGATLKYRQLLKKRQLWVLPVVNLDGFGLNGEGGWRCNANAVNLNRDLPVTWSLNTTTGTGSISCRGNGDRTGPWPISQSETLAIINTLTLAQPAILMNGHGWRTGITGTTDPSCRRTQAVWTNGTPSVRPGATAWKTGDNWGWTGHFSQYTWNGTGYNTSVNWGLTDFAQHIGRDDGIYPYNLAKLSELERGGSRHYAPYHDSYACDTRNFSRQGRSRGPSPGGLGAWTWIGTGAVSFLLEHLRVYEDGNTGVLYGSDGEPIEHWDTYRAERHIGSLTRDDFPAYARLAEIAENPLPSATNFSDSSLQHSAVNNLAVTRIADTYGTCQPLRTWWDPTVGPWNVATDANVLPETILRGPTGNITPSCTITNWGTQPVNDADARISVIRTNPGSSPTILATESIRGRTAASPLLNAGDSYTFALATPIDFIHGNEYEVRCDIIAGTEGYVNQGSSHTTPSVNQVTILGDQACEAEARKLRRLGGLRSTPYRCTKSSGSSIYNTTWHTNNARTIRFVSEVNVNDTCSTSPVSMTGIPIHHVVPAIVVLP